MTQINFDGVTNCATCTTQLWLKQYLVFRGSGTLKRVIATLSLTLIFLISAIALAQSSGGDFAITKSTIDNGGGISTNGDFSLTGTIGQADANHQISTGGEFALAGGFWADATVIDLIFKDSFESN
jgi:hypothetical protein